MHEKRETVLKLSLLDFKYGNYSNAENAESEELYQELRQDSIHHRFGLVGIFFEYYSEFDLKLSDFEASKG